MEMEMIIPVFVSKFAPALVLTYPLLNYQYFWCETDLI